MAQAATVADAAKTTKGVQRGLKAKTAAQNKGKERLHISLSPRSYELLKDMMEKTEASNYAEVFRNALRLYSAFIEEAEKGNEFYVRTPEGEYKQYKVFV